MDKIQENWDTKKRYWYFQILIFEDCANLLLAFGLFRMLILIQSSEIVMENFDFYLLHLLVVVMRLQMSSWLGCVYDFLKIVLNVVSYKVKYSVVFPWVWWFAIILPSPKSHGEGDAFDHLIAYSMAYCLAHLIVMMGV